MFKTNTNRLNYGEMLMSPDGFRLESAIGTTYSLDLETLTAIAFSMGLSEETDSDLMHNPVGLLNALSTVSNKIVIFCESGQIKLPSSASSMYLLLEKMIVPVSLPYGRKMKTYPAFHPKTWTVTYSNSAGEKLYRFIVLSRNLTFDRSWDVAVSLDGKLSGRTQPKSKPIVDFLEFLNKQIKSDYTGAWEKRAILSHAMKELLKVKFEPDSKEFTDFQIMPMGIGEGQYDFTKDPFMQDTFHEAVVMSPFLSGSVIEELNKPEKALKDCRRTLITRRTELEKIQNGRADHFDVYVMKDAVIDGEEALSSDTSEKQQQDIHAKIYIRRKGSLSELYLGSMNATYSAMNKNVEMMLKLPTMKRYLDTDSFLQDIFGGSEDNPGNPFEAVDLTKTLPEAQPDEADALEKVVKKICRLRGKAAVTEDKGKYKISICFDTEEEFENTVISPLRSNKSYGIVRNIEFPDLDLMQLSEFYKLEVKGKTQKIERVIMIPTANIPDGRDREIVESVVKDKQTFIEYVSFVLSDDYMLTFLENTKMKTSGIDRSDANLMPAIYEKMLRTALTDKEKISEINYVLNMIENKNIIPDEFRETYETFKRTLKLK